MYKKWAEKFTWSKVHDSTIKKIFDHRASKRFSGMMEDVRKRKEQLTQWCRPELKKAIYNFWETNERYKHTEATNKANRASEKAAKYTGGSATPMQTKNKMTKSFDRPVSMAEVFKQTHTLKENKEKFADKRSADIWNEYINNIAITTQRAAEFRTSAPMDPDEVWLQTVSEPDAKNHIYDVGGFLASTLRTFVFTL
ncbi:hypothetical protein PIB30_057165 [Stylosanthes scabra]|uniref:Uncharacterized protein n=1 Tax=Stylosanthes scabra TaxID=79078 RepID=A0ABU6YHR9_9FABA|nr:hypothetical protein [Stylosanthes scabra]